jgi:rare lipoprotein A
LPNAASAALPLPDAAPAPAPVASAAAAGFWVQLGAFRQREGALGFRQRVAAELDWIAPLLAVFNDASVHRLQAGPYASRDEASAVAERLHDALKLVPVIVERRTAVQ